MAPTLTAVPQQFGRVLLTLTWPGLNVVPIQRLDPDGTWRNVRNAEPVICAGSTAAFDHEAPLDQPVTYRAVLPQIAADSFTRTSASSWGTADTGQAWTVTGTASDFAVGSGVGTQSNSTVNAFRSATLNVGATDFDITVDTSLPIATAIGGAATVWVCGRLTDLNNYYAARLDLNTAGRMDLGLFKRVTGTLSGSLSSAASIGAHTANALWRVRFRGTGSTLQAKAWLPPNPEPAAWMASATDTALTSGSLVGLLSRLETGNTNTSPVVFTFDHLSVNSLTSPLTATSSPTTLPSGSNAWLSHPGHPKYASATTVADLQAALPGRAGLFQPIGAALPIAVTDIRGGAQGTVTWQAQTAAQYQQIRALVGDGAVLLMRLPATWSGDTWYIAAGNIVEDRFSGIATDGWRRYQMPYTRVDRPAGASDGAVGITCADVPATYATCTALAAAKATCTALATSVV
jgi:hypothetical protein